jgi:hypothetical protein
MEEAGIDWSCKTCKEQVGEKAAPIDSDKVVPADPEMAAPADLESEEMEADQPESLDPADEDYTETMAATPRSGGRRSKATSRRRKSSETQEKPKPRAARCHMCTKPPRLSSIYCSGEWFTWGTFYIILVSEDTSGRRVP